MVAILRKSIQELVLMPCFFRKRKLKNEGLRYDDLYDPIYDLDIKEALSRLPHEIVDALQRLKRAMDLSMKHEYLPDSLQRRDNLSLCTVVQWISTVT